MNQKESQKETQKEDSKSSITLNPILEPTLDLKSEIQELKTRVDNLEKNLEGMNSIIPKELNGGKTDISQEAKAEIVEDYPIPEDFKDIVETTLNKRFRMRLHPMKDTPAYLFTIIVPSIYSKITDEDIRPKVIQHGEGVNGVRMWAEKVFSSFDHGLQEKIISDRPFI